MIVVSRVGLLQEHHQTLSHNDIDGSVRGKCCTFLPIRALVSWDYCEKSIRQYGTAGSSRQGVGTVHASSNFAALHHYES